MPAIELKLITHQSEEGLAYQHLRIRLRATDGIITPKDLQQLQLPKGIDSTKGIVVEGKGPIWLYAYLTHECHTTAWVGCYDPRLGGAVVVESHSGEVSVGEVWKLQLP
ncbi:CRISPR-associated ring nuclease Crn3/Csx3 [Ancylothrix sp. C2]|uniref:CRISPR-associated ring nuclease Crn3/Csx3 n=1 Tax=Ancylothrix sp. D3o TaxID=2953691 RepID=UPI0021BB8148|nr:CRISPR-associated ring nuclease Crn3/Csx3 [Ancylothrix sp. D3o]MCT7948546.1 CRISPR-associated ring nuclease Crn3/Csx3 [Ancylothrix sp. D3o]